MDTNPHDRALTWLAGAAPDPEECRVAWEHNGFGLALLPAGRRWDALLAPAPLGHLAAKALAKAGNTGPMLADVVGRYVGFLVPVGTAARWVGTGVRVAGAGTWIAVPHPARRTRGLHWLSPPDGSGALIDPALLELALHDAAAGLRSAD